MAVSPVTDKEFLELWETHKSAAKVSELTGIGMSNVYRRRRRIEQKMRLQLHAVDSRSRHFKHLSGQPHPHRKHFDCQNGIVIVFSDAHFWPNVRSTAFRGLLRFIQELKPKAIINNGDAFDGASISRFPRIGWDSKPSVIEELRACKERLGEIEDYAEGAKLFWPLGNHDARFETRLAANAPEFEGVKGFTLKDHLPNWQPCWSVWVNESVVIKHRYKGGIHATHNNTVNSGRSIVTGHLHSLKVTPFNDYDGTRWGVDTGTLAETDGPQFVDYLEDNPTNWRAGFAVLTFHDGKLLWPEVARVIGHNLIDFRGHVIDVAEE